MTHYCTRNATQDENQWLTFTVGGSNDDIDAGNAFPGAGEGVMLDRILVDLSQAMSQRLGRQMSMMSTYKVNYISIALVNSPEGDNKQGALAVGGKIEYHAPTQHKIDALGLARATEKAKESSEIDGDSWLLSTSPSYRGLRFNWSGDDEVVYPSPESFANLSGDQWDMQEIFQIYNAMHPSTKNNTLWSAGRAGYQDSIGWSCAYHNQTDIDSEAFGAVDEQFNPNSFPFIWNVAPGQEIEVLGGLMNIQINHCNMPEPFSQVDDDYYVQVTIGVSGWRDF